MQHKVDACRRFADGIEIENVGFAEVDLAEHLGEIFAPAGGEVVDAPDLVAALQQSADQRRSDKARQLRSLDIWPWLIHDNGCTTQPARESPPPRKFCSGVHQTAVHQTASRRNNSRKKESGAPPGFGELQKIFPGQPLVLVKIIPHPIENGPWIDRRQHVFRDILRGRYGRGDSDSPTE